MLGTILKTNTPNYHVLSAKANLFGFSTKMIQNYIGVYSVSMSRVWVLLLAEREHTEEKKTSEERKILREYRQKDYSKIIYDHTHYHTHIHT